MFSALGRFVTRLPWLVVVLWIAAAVLAGALAPALTSTQDSSEFLPDSYESIKAANLQSEAFPDAQTPGAILVFDRTDGTALTAADTASITEVTTQLQGELEKAFTGIAVQQPAPDGAVQLAIVGLSPDATGFDTQSMDAVKALRSDAEKLLGDGDVRLQVTGAAAQSLDSQESGDTALAIVGIVTIFLIVFLLAIIFRSVIICLIPVVLVSLVSVVATGLIGVANKVFDLKADSSLQAILLVVLYGIGTDYILFLLFRYRERLRAGDDTKTAVQGALHRAGEAILSAGGAVIVAFMALVLSSLSIFRTIGPALAIAVAVTLVAALTLVPAVLTLLGKALFWPSKAWKKEPEAARFAAIGRAMGRSPLRYALVAGGVLAILSVFALGFKPSFDFSSSLPAEAESTQALDTLQKSLPAGSTDPTTVLLTGDDPLDPTAVASYAAALGSVDGVANVSPGVPSADGRTTLFSVVLQDDPGSEAASDLVEGPLRTAAHDDAPDGTTAYVGGTTAVFVDLDKAMARDYSVVFPVAALVIFLILALLLRSVVAPLYMMISVGLGFGATLGASVIVFQHIQGESGLIFLLPIYIYLFVVALGTDYNILMIARLREEARAGRSPREAVGEAIKHAGPTVAAAGLILAGTFASLIFGGNSLFASLGFALAFGIAVSAFVMAMFFTPALTTLLGHRAWWPGHGDAARPGDTAAPGEEKADHEDPARP